MGGEKNRYFVFSTLYVMKTFGAFGTVYDRKKVKEEYMLDKNRPKRLFFQRSKNLGNGGFQRHIFFKEAL